MAPKRVLLLGGTTEASQFALAIEGRHRVTTSFAGRTEAPQAAAGATRVGGFGGTSGLIDFLRASSTEVLVDATHPFAARMRHHAADAAHQLALPRLRLERPPWIAGPRDRWIEVGSIEQAASESTSYQRVLLTVGRTGLAPFQRCAETSFVVRAITAPDIDLPHAEVLLARGPFTVDEEIRLISSHDVQAIVSKNSGGEATAAKLEAARHLGIPVIMVRRPPNPPGPLAATIAEAVNWLD